MGGKPLQLLNITIPNGQQRLLEPGVHLNNGWEEQFLKFDILSQIRSNSLHLNPSGELERSYLASY